MDLQHFNAVVDDQLNEIRDILVAKGAEYVPGDAKSRFHNFEVGAALNGQTNTECLWGYLTKHLVSLADMVEGDSTQHSMEKWAEKLSDSITYLVLLRAMVSDNEQDNALANLRSKLGGVDPYIQTDQPPGAKAKSPNNILIHHTDAGNDHIPPGPAGGLGNMIKPQQY